MMDLSEISRAKKQIFCYHFCVESKHKTNDYFNKNRKRLKDIENKLVVTSELSQVGRGNIAVENQEI